MSEKDGVNVTSGCNAEDPNVIDNKKQQGTEDVIIEQPIVCEKVSTTPTPNLNISVTEKCLEFLSYLCAVLLFPFSLLCMFEIVEDDENAVIRRWNESEGRVEGPGCFCMNPCLDTVTKIPMQTKQFDIKFTTLTKGDDNVKVKAVLSLRVTDPLIAINKFKKPEETITALETNTLHNSLITYTTEDILLKRQEVLDDLKNLVKDATGSLGVEIERVEITDAWHKETMDSEADGDSTKTKENETGHNIKTEQAVEVIETSADTLQCILDCISCLGGDDS